MRAFFRSRRDTQVLAECYWQPDRRSRPTLLALHGLEGIEHGALHARARAQGARRRAQRRAAESAKLRRHRASGARSLSLGPEQRRGVRDQGACPRGPRLCRRSGVFAWRQPRDEAGRRTSARDASVTRGGVRRFPGPRARRVRSRARAPVQFHLPVELRAQPEGAHAPEGSAATRGHSPSIDCRTSGPSARSTRSTLRRISDFRAPPTITIARQACASWTESGFRRW